MSRKEVDVELKEAAKSNDIFNRRIIFLTQMLLRIKGRIDRYNLIEIFAEIYLSDKSKSLEEIAEKLSIDSKTLRRKRILFNRIFLETKNEVLNLQNDFFIN